ncbi:2-phosphosulfolactate phosphatase [Streptomyces sp. PanSC19]|uniref:2-phosphosulfolactate phosphatase n=1 Tax=Streptomyces sp. PanSC19 TaxID=1520455 RepID=UPI000F491A38|nr:2-phosphosulfolactate phosphatase [Streptomyces sp. PanSC19]ROQ35437.1 2-phosphosulfolactate phosphatase [Streptomyces sp. PanSC19]
MTVSFGRGPVAARVLAAARGGVVDVLSSNGSTVAARAASGGATVVAVSPRDHSAGARRLRGRGDGTADRPLAVTASGERRPDGSPRPVPEDLPGAGALPSALRGTHTLTPEATAAATLRDATEDPVAALHGRDSGRELYEYGFPQDVAVAAGLDRSTTVPVLVEGAFQEAR